MQLLLLFLLLSMQGGKLTNKIKPLLETMDGEDIKNALNGAEQIAEVMQLANFFMPQAPTREDFQPVAEDICGKNEEDSPFAAVSSFADPEIIAALNGVLYNI